MNRFYSTIPLCLIMVMILLSSCDLDNSGVSEDPTSSTAALENAVVAAQHSAANTRENPLRNAYFGETHVHTSYSLDAYLGGTRLKPADAYRYAKGELVVVNGVEHKRRRPLDFVAVTDHAEYIGEMYSAIYEQAPGYDHKLLKELRSLTDIESRQAWFVKYVVSSNRSTVPQHPPFFAGKETVTSAWKLNVKAAEEHYAPGTFTTLIAFEWSAAPNGGNLHRNVIFRDGSALEAPVSYIDINREEGLWDWMSAQEAKGMSVIAIPHNSNASKGMMFSSVDSSGNPITDDYAKKRQYFEPLVEMMQTKGNSEVHLSFWSADEFADFENADSIQKSSGREFIKNNFVREGLKLGLGFEQSLGTNPFKMGFIGGTDNHNGLAGDVAEDTFMGSHGIEDGSVERRRVESIAGWIDSRDQSIGSLAGVWAPENTREAIWDAMKKRETFTTSGTRIKVRFFGGGELPAETRDPVSLVEKGYALGAPMGADLGPVQTSPTFNVYASKDPDGANLDRIQIIKGWVDSRGDLHEKVIDVAWSGDRKIGAEGKLPAVGNTVDLNTATYTNHIGSSTLIGSWTDTEFNADEHYFYYARVLEIPTPRWTTFDAVRNNLPLLEDVPATIQERAWSSPIWYKPSDAALSDQAK
jgi:hypothetical protein